MTSEIRGDALHRRLAKLIGTEEPFAWAKRVGIPSATWSRIWNEKTIPKAEHLCRIADHAGVTLDWLLTGQGVQFPISEDVRQHLAARLQEEIAALEDAQAARPSADILGRAIAVLRYNLAEIEGRPATREIQAARNEAVHGFPQRGEPINSGALTGAIAAVDELLVERSVSLAPEKKAKMVVLVYNQLTKAASGGQIERGLINDLLDLAS